MSRTPLKETAVWSPYVVSLARSEYMGAARLCGHGSGITLGICLPVVMVVSNKSAPVFLVLGALFSIASVVLAGRTPALVARARMLMQNPAAVMIGAILILMGTSLLWSTDRALTARGLIEGLPVLVSAFVCAAAWPLVFRRGDERFLLAGVAAAALLIGVEKGDDLALHRLVGSRDFHSDLKRSAVPLAILLWPALAFCKLTGKAAVPTSLVALVVAGVVLAHSGASFFALIAGGLAFAVARWWPGPALGVVTFGLVVIVIGSGWAGTSAKHGLAAPLVSGLSSVHAAQRIRIWRAFERRVFERPALGHGFNTSQGVSPDLLPEDMTPELSSRSLARIHPHSMFLQIWVELGMAGIAASLASVLFVLSRIGRSAADLPLHLGLFLTIVCIGLVSMSAWQPWWLAVTATSLLWLRVARQEPSGSLTP